MTKAQIKLASWDKVYDFIDPELDLKVGDQVIVKIDSSLELGTVVSISDHPLNNNQNLASIIRLANSNDLANLPTESQKNKILIDCQKTIDRHALDMKLIDVQLSLDNSRLNFAFSSSGRVDFRDLVKDLSGQFNASIRLTQIGSRDEAKILGDCGPCGFKLCCQGAMKEFCSITSEMAEAQQVANRGSDRISGMCGRLKCCLSFEYEGYKYLEKKLPPCGTKVNVDGLRGVVVQQHILKQTVDVKIPAQSKDDHDTIIEVDINRHKPNHRKKK